MHSKRPLAASHSESLSFIFAPHVFYFSSSSPGVYIKIAVRLSLDKSTNLFWAACLSLFYFVCFVLSEHTKPFSRFLPTKPNSVCISVQSIHQFLLLLLVRGLLHECPLVCFVSFFLFCFSRISWLCTWSLFFVFFSVSKLLDISLIVFCPFSHLFTPNSIALCFLGKTACCHFEQISSCQGSLSFASLFVFHFAAMTHFLPSFIIYMFVWLPWIQTWKRNELLWELRMILYLMRICKSSFRSHCRFLRVRHYCIFSSLFFCCSSPPRHCFLH